MRQQQGDWLTVQAADFIQDGVRRSCAAEASISSHWAGPILFKKQTRQFERLNDPRSNVFQGTVVHRI
ncbi:hypothetical protein EYF80_011808 [Liparis tanakae]|uniref:Uncharacterized protein n=1 Tax=Liparis tanakae TaxID=230148 RepID=A0A4Z2IKP0_9TELE|nr:hypothetical protein EYF80_011808 [Liparis tanakae]